MITNGTTARARLSERIAVELAAGASAAELVETAIRLGWQPGPALDPHSDYVEGVLDSGGRVRVEIRHARTRRAA